MSGAGIMDSHDGLFAQLLKPIKDLAENWNIEIANVLDVYIEELHNTAVSFDGGETTMNFAEAAMVLQSSTCVYSKKVEYLYSLVFKVLNTVSHKDKKGQKSSVDGEGNDEDINFTDDNDEEFLSLDDIPDKKDWIRKEDFDSSEKFQLLPKVPLCMLPKEEEDKSENALLSKKGEVLASLNDFKIYTSLIHSSGMLYIDKSYLKLVEETVRTGQLTTCKGTELAADLIQPETRGDGELRMEDEPYDVMPAADSFEDNMEPDKHLQEANTDDQTIVGTHAAAKGSDRPRREAVTENRQPQKKSVYEPLEPFEDVGRDKPLKKGKKCIKLCPGIASPTRKRKKTKPTFCHEMLRIDKFVWLSCFSKLKQLPKTDQENEMMVVLEKQYWEEKKKRDALEKKWLQQRRALRLTEGRGEDVIDDENEVEAEVDGREADMDDDDGNDNDMEMESPLVDDDLFNAIDMVATKNVFSENGERDEDTEDHLTIGESYEDMVQRYVEQYLASAQEFVQITELSKRVSDWEEKIIPRLQEEDSHRPFDINTYGSSILDNLLKGKSTMFKNVVQGKPQYEVCRVFLAMLMLANTGNLKIDGKEGSLDEIMDKFGLELLSTRRHFEDLQEYQAPSLGTNS